VASTTELRDDVDTKPGPRPLGWRVHARRACNGATTTATATATRTPLRSRDDAGLHDDVRDGGHAIVRTGVRVGRLPRRRGLQRRRRRLRWRHGRGSRVPGASDVRWVQRRAAGDTADRGQARGAPGAHVRARARAVPRVAAPPEVSKDPADRAARAPADRGASAGRRRGSRGRRRSRPGLARRPGSGSQSRQLPPGRRRRGGGARRPPLPAGGAASTCRWAYEVGDRRRRPPALAPSPA
jgi:hypothetical protein